MDKNVIYKRDLFGVNWQEMKANLTTDDFDNGRTAEQLQRSFTNSRTTSIAIIDGRIVGTARALSDGVCNAYIVDVWTYTPFRHQGIARQMVDDLLSDLPGQHVYMFTDDIPEFYRKLGFVERGIGMECVVGSWLQN